MRRPYTLFQDPYSSVAGVKIEVSGDTPEQAAKLLAEQLERRAETIRLWLFGDRRS